MKISILIPFFNEIQALPFLIEELSKFIGKNHDKSFEVIFIDDGSNDGSSDKIFDQNPDFNFSIIKLSKNFGSHAALRAGILHATGEYITFQYADLQDPLELILKLNEKCKKGVDIVWGRRKKTQSGLFSTLYSKLMKKFVNPNYPSQGFDVVMFSEKVKEQINKNIEANSSLFLQILNLGFRQSSITYVKSKRVQGTSKWTISKKTKLFIDSFVAFSFLPIRLVSILGVFMFICGFSFAGYLIFRRLVFDDLVSGWPALISILTIGFGVTNISLGIIAEYLWRTLDASRKRPVFIIDQIIDKRNSNEQN